MRTISLTAHRRTQYLDQTLRALSRCIGIEKYDVRVFCDWTPKSRRRAEVASIVKRYGFTPVANDRPLGCAANTGFAIGSAFDAGARYHIHMEEDTVPCRGALLWFEWAERLGDDERFFTVSGYNRVPSGSVSDCEARAWFHPWGFAMWADRWERVAWRGSVLEGWDVRLNKVRGDRLEAFPSVSRMQNIGVHGLHTPSPRWHAQHHRARATTDDLVSAFEFRATP